MSRASKKFFYWIFKLPKNRILKICLISVTRQFRTGLDSVNFFHMLASHSGNNQGNNKEESSTSKEIGSSSGTTCASVTNNQMESSESKPEQPSRRSCSIM